MPNHSQNTGSVNTYNEIVNSTIGPKKEPTYWEITMAHSGGLNGLQKGRRHGADIVKSKSVIV